MYEHERVADVRRELLLVLHELVKNLLLGDFGLVVEVLEGRVLDFERVMNLRLQRVGIVIELVDLKADF